MTPARLGSHYATPQAARRAIELVAPMIEAWRSEQRVIGSGFLYVVVMDPALSPATSVFEDAILCERAFGDEAGWDADYRALARDKARLSWSSGVDAHRLHSAAPHLLRDGDSLLWGSVCIDGIVVGASGAFPWYDEMFAGAIALALRALAKEARSAERGRFRIGETAAAPATA